VRPSTSPRTSRAAAYVVVESFVTGRDYRCLIVGGRMQAIAERVPAHVVGDGEHTVKELVDITNADPRRGVGHEKVLTKIKVDAAAIELVREQGFELDSCPRSGPWSSSPSPATCPPAASRSTGPSTPTPTTSRSPRRQPGWSASTSRGSTSSPRTSPPRCARPAGRSVR
jgi:hypothetical protein